MVIWRCACMLTTNAPPDKQGRIVRRTFVRKIVKTERFPAHDGSFLIKKQLSPSESTRRKCSQCGHKNACLLALDEHILIQFHFPYSEKAHQHQISFKSGFEPLQRSVSGVWCAKYGALQVWPKQIGWPWWSHFVRHQVDQILSARRLNSFVMNSSILFSQRVLVASDIPSWVVESLTLTLCLVFSSLPLSS